MFNEVLSAIEAGDRTRARDLLTRLLKTTQDNVDYWIWMSAVVESTKERSFCLNQALKVDPQNSTARRGLMMVGQQPLDPALVLPARLQKRNWQSKLLPVETDKSLGGPPIYQAALMVVALMVVVGLVLFFVLGDFFKGPPVQPTQVVRRWPTETIEPSVTPATAVAAARTNAPTASQPTPLWMLLDATYTPTPLYVNTPHPASVAEAYKIGLRAFHRGEWSSVELYMKQVATGEPEAADAPYYIAETYRLQGKNTQAIKAYTDLIKRFPRFAPSYLGRALTRLAVNENDVKPAQADLETAISIDPNLGDAHLALAQLLLNSGSDGQEQALEVLEQAAQVLPESPLVYLYRGEAYLLAGDAEQALENAQRANQLDETLLPAYLLLGQALRETGDIDGSLQALGLYATYVDDDPRVWYWIALAQEANGDVDAALKAYDQALRMDNQLYDAHLRRAQIQLADDNAESALEDFRTALRLNESFEAALGVGKALLMLGYEGDAYMQFERSQGLAEDDADKAALFYWRAQSLEALGELEVALREWNALLALPEDALPAAWIDFAQERVAKLVTATPTPVPPTYTPTPSPTETRQPTRTRTHTPSKTAAPSRSPTPTR